MLCFQGNFRLVWLKSCKSFPRKKTRKNLKNFFLLNASKKTVGPTYDGKKHSELVQGKRGQEKPAFRLCPHKRLYAYLILHFLKMRLNQKIWPLASVFSPEKDQKNQKNERSEKPV